MSCMVSTPQLSVVPPQPQGLSPGPTAVHRTAGQGRGSGAHHKQPGVGRRHSQLGAAGCSLLQFWPHVIQQGTTTPPSSGPGQSQAVSAVQSQVPFQWVAFPGLGPQAGSGAQPRWLAPPASAGPLPFTPHGTPTASPLPALPLQRGHPQRAEKRLRGRAKSLAAQRAGGRALL